MQKLGEAGLVLTSEDSSISFDVTQGALGG
jgi:hypothetical protein